jgi:hypothetical protein
MKKSGSLILDAGARAETPAKSPKIKPPLYDATEIKALFEVEDAALTEILGRLMAGARGTVRLDAGQLKALLELHAIRSARLGNAGAAVDRIEVVFGDDPDEGSEDR